MPMIDFNERPQPAVQDPRAAREHIRAGLIARLESVLAGMFAAGRVCDTQSFASVSSGEVRHTLLIPYLSDIS